MPKILHFADAHIDMTILGTHDPISGLPTRVMDFLKSLDTIVNTAIEEKVDLVIFAGDTYRDRNPQPTYQREWDRRIMKLSQARIPTLLLTGNHDISPAHTRAHAMQELETLTPPFVRVVSKVELLSPEDLFGVPVQVIAVPWITRAAFVAANQDADMPADETVLNMEIVLTEMVKDMVTKLDPSIPTILTAHASIEGAKYGNEQNIKIGKDLTLPLSFATNPSFDYVALGHIHKFQDLNTGSYPPVVYPGSIERVDFGEIHEDKGFVIAHVLKGTTTYEWRLLQTRPFMDISVSVLEDDRPMEKILAAVPSDDVLKNAIVRLRVDYPRAMEPRIDWPRVQGAFGSAFSFSWERNPDSRARTRTDGGEGMATLSPMELMDSYWKRNNVSKEAQDTLRGLANQIISDVNGGPVE